MKPHTCATSDGMRIGCVCKTGRDHTEDEFDQEGETVDPANES